MGFTVFMVSAYAADDSYDVNSKKEIRFPLTLATFVIAIAVWLLLTVFLYCNKKEPEIQSQNRYFRAQILVCSGLSVFCKFVAFLIQYKYSQVNHYARIIVIGVGVQAYYGVLSAILLKLRFIYTICVKQELRPSYSTGFLYHIPLIIFSVVPLYVCSFASVSCSQAAVWSGSWCMLAFFMLEFGFYLWNVRPVPGLFVDFSSNIRVFCFISITYLGSMTYTLVEGRPLYVYDLSYIVFPFSLYVAWFEIFGLIVIKIAGRRCGTQWLKDANLQGVAGAFLQTRDGTMDFVLSDTFMLQKFRKLTRKRRCEETLDALIGCRAIGYLFEIGSIVGAGQLTEQWVITHITGRDLCQHVNIGYESREALLQTIELLHVSVPISATTMQTFMDIDQNLSFMLRTHVIALFKTEEVVEHCLKLLALAKVGFLNVDGSGVKPLTQDASTDIVVVSTAHS